MRTWAPKRASTSSTAGASRRTRWFTCFSFRGLSALRSPSRVRRCSSFSSIGDCPGASSRGTSEAFTWRRMSTWTWTWTPPPSPMVRGQVGVLLQELVERALEVEDRLAGGGGPDARRPPADELLVVGHEEGRALVTREALAERRDGL